jgi:hypothetical protein
LNLPDITRAGSQDRKRVSEPDYRSLVKRAGVGLRYDPNRTGALLLPDAGGPALSGGRELRVGKKKRLFLQSWLGRTAKGM